MRAKFVAYPDAMREKLLELRDLIYEVAADNDDIGPLEETLKWNEPAYLTTRSKSGTTIRINAHKGSASEFGLYVSCQTDLLDRYRALYSDDLRFEGNRAILFEAVDPLPIEPLRHCIAMALLYHHT
ncbi:DUF1801 domain-containing protein [Parasphingopyxis algicola]|nr:DUF1801 domain-containing protein [Parasphingopyxis algicola]